MKVLFEFPPIYTIDYKWKGNIIQQLKAPSFSRDVTITKINDSNNYVLSIIDSNEEILLTKSDNLMKSKFKKILTYQGKLVLNKNSIRIAEIKLKWFKHPDITKISVNKIDFTRETKKVINSWKDCFHFNEEKKGIEKGLRSPQIGAVHAIHAHWSVSDKTSTIVMPTGTGKTETMLSILVSRQCEKLLVIVYSNALRIQISNKFLNLGILKQLNVISKSAKYPIVGILNHKLKNIDEVNNFFQKCNVIITTIKIASESNYDVQEHMAHHCPFLFIDEAHHIAADKWYKIKESFKNRKIIQFTATPFRNDDRPIGGKIIYNYPMKKAQEEGYFKKIRFKPVREYDLEKSDDTIAEQALKQLMIDHNNNFNHVLMARVNSIKRANEVYNIYINRCKKLYKNKYRNFKPVQIHTGIKNEKERNKIKNMIITSESKIVICVDMLGEGFDLPELKIAAFHDIKKSLPITLQLVGRFTRERSDLGDPTFIANIADNNVAEEIQKLYFHDSDWNILLHKGSQEATQNQIRLWKFLEGFDQFPKYFPLQNIRPAMSTAIYRTKCNDWKPENFLQGIKDKKMYDDIYHDINYEEKTMIIITRKRIPIKWAKIHEVFSWDWELYILYWDSQNNLLFINNSVNKGYFKSLAEAVAGDVELIKGDDVFRCFSGINRLKLKNAGLIRRLGRLIRYTMNAGSDVEPGISEAQRRGVFKSNFIGDGYENGIRTSVGCSYKGRIWSHRNADIEEWTRWCKSIGRKVINKDIEPDDFFKGTLIPEYIARCPSQVPIGIDWPEEIYMRPETTYSFSIDNKKIPLYMTDIVIDTHERENILFFIESDKFKIGFEFLPFKRNGIFDFKINTVGKDKLYIDYGSNSILLNDFLYQNPPVIWFADGSSLSGNSYIVMRHDLSPYNKDKIVVWDWTNINIQKESQGIEKEKDTIQYCVIRNLQNKDYDILFDDDGSGEIADVVGIKDQGDQVLIELYHCKYSKEKLPGSRIDDLYVVCGQAQKCIFWQEKTTEIFTHLLRRDHLRVKRGLSTRFEKGDVNGLEVLRQKSYFYPSKINIYIVQPGVSKNAISRDILRLLSVTENYLMETYQLPFQAITSK